MTSTREHRRQLYERLIGQTIADRYEIVALMGFGGMGAVYEAIQRNMNRRIALKFIPSHNPVTAARFEREALTVSQLRHPNTVTVFDYGQTDDGFLYLTMEMLAGRTLTDLIKEESPLAAEKAVHIASQICRSLSEAHRMGIVHRDVKPDNIFLIAVDDDPNVVKVLDFGIAKVVQGEDDPQLTGDGRIIGTPRYMSPEQILSQDIDHRSDIYSLGCIIFEMLCAAPPFQQSSTTALMISHAQDPPPPFAEHLSDEVLGQIPLALEHVVRKALTKSPAQRQQTTDELREELEAALRSLKLPSPTGTGSRRPLTAEGSVLADLRAAEQLPPSKSHRAALAVIGLAIGVIAILGIYHFFFNAAEEPASQPIIAIADPTEVGAGARGADTPGESHRSNHVQVTIDSEPRGARVLEGEENMGHTPLNLSLPSDVQTLTYVLELEGYQRREVEIALTANTTRRQEFSFLLLASPKMGVEEKPVAEPVIKQERRPVTKRTEPREQSRKENKDEDSAEAKNDSQTADPPPRVPRIDRLDDAPRPRVDRL